jgi:hypothetical protein
MFAILAETIKLELQTLHGASQNDPTPRLPLVSLAKLGFDCLNNEVLLVLL